MASFHSNASNEEDILPTSYSPSKKLTSYSSSGLPNNKAYASQPSVSESYLNLLSSSTILTHDHVGNNHIRRSGERTIIPPTGFPTDVREVDTQLNFMCRFSDCDTLSANTHAFTKELEHGHGPEQKSLSHGLYLSLGSQEQSLDQMTSTMNQYSNSNLCSLLSSHVLQSEDHLSQRIDLKNVEYLSFDLSGGNHDAVECEVMNNFQNLISSKDTISLPFLHQTSEFSGVLCNSKYLKAAQDLLDEVVNVHRALETSEKGKNKNLLGPDGPKETGARRGETSAEFYEPTTNAPDLSLSPSERHNLQNKMTKLVSMLKEVDKRYKQYLHQMQAVVSSFDMVAGHGAAKQYSALALRTISSQFRSLRDAIKKQIQDTENSLGEQDADSHGQGVLSRLRYVDQKLRQQKIVQQFGIMRQPWRPQRGLPETAVSVLRAWLFEHFLHPYPKDSEKSILARQTGLTRSQVANWFINARVRLWKPMIEDIYKEEFGEPDTEPKSSPEHAPVTQEVPALKGLEEELQESLMSAASDGKRWAHSVESRHDIFSSAELSYEARVFHENEISYGLTHLQKQHIDEDSRHKVMILDGSMGNQVSLALGYTRGEIDSQPISVDNKLKGNDGEPSSMGVDKLEYYDEDTINHQARTTSDYCFAGTGCAFIPSAAMGSSKYLKPAQSLLEEMVNIGSKEIDISNKKYVEKLSRLSKSGSFGYNEELSEKPGSCVHLLKLLTLLQEVERRYEEYYNHMEELVSCFEAIAGVGAGKSYTALALQAMSKHFCILRNAILSQIRATKRKLEADMPRISSRLGQLSLLDQENRLNRTTLQQQQLGIMQSWRLIRGLPEKSVMILRAWLFEHFLHPYPNDSEKLVLASQTGLSKNQVSNWFINARVRLWKPMIEQMYKEEFAASSTESDELLTTAEGIGDSVEER